jgi:hypothetical protein
VSAYAELLVGPLRRGATGAVTIARFLVDLGVRIELLSTEIARRAAALRARHRSPALPDALALATGETIGATLILAADRAWAAVGRRVRILQE